MFLKKCTIHTVTITMSDWTLPVLSWPSSCWTGCIKERVKYDELCTFKIFFCFGNGSTNVFYTQKQGLNCKFAVLMVEMYNNTIKFPNKCSFCLLYELLVLFVALFGGGFIVLMSLLNLETSFNLSPEYLQADVCICI